MEKELISIIVPVYKVEKYIKTCVDSIINQTYKNIEIILIDDGSPDNCPNICDEYGKIDKRIVVVHKKNGGLSDARNVGIKIARGEYVTFVDSDDYLNRNFIGDMYNAIEDSGADISICDFIEVDEEEVDQFDHLRYTEDKDLIMNNIECLVNTYRPRLHGMSFVTWGKMYKKALFIDNRIEFPVGKIHEDTFTTYKLLYFASLIIFKSNKLYYYRKRSGSIMDQGFTLKSLDKLEAEKQATLFFQKNNKILLGHALNAELITCINFYKKAVNEKKEIKDKIKNQYLFELNQYSRESELSIVKKLYFKIYVTFLMK